MNDFETQDQEMERHSQSRPCPVCGGWSALPKGRGIRCAGFTLSRVVYCTREEYAGNLPLDINLSPPAFKHRAFGSCGCGQAHGWAFVGQSRPRDDSPYLGLEERHAIYSAALELLTLREPDLGELRRRGLDRDTALRVGYRSLPNRGREATAFMRDMVARFGEERLRRCPGFTDKNGRLNFRTAQGDGGYLVPYRDERRRLTGLQIRTSVGYSTPRGTRLDHVYSVSGKAGGRDLYVTEGATKGIVAHELAGLSTFAVAGQALKPAHIEAMRALGPARVIVAMDEEDNPNTARARERWIDALWRAGLPVFRATWEGVHVGGWKGIDDLLRAGHRPRVRNVSVTPPEISVRRTPRPTGDPGHVAGGTTLAEARAATERAVCDFMRRAAKGDAVAQLVRAAPGAGKTHAAATAAREHRLLARVLVGTNRLAREQADRYGYRHVEGRNEANCGRYDVVQALAAGGHDVDALACGTEKKQRCPIRDRCAYIEQFRHVGSRVGAAEQLYNPRFLKGGSVIVLDDADLMRTMLSHDVLDQHTIGKAYRSLGRSRRRPLRTLLKVVGYALAEAQSDPRPVIGARVWDLLAEASLLSVRRPLLDVVADLPAHGTMPRPRDGVVLTVEDVGQLPPGGLLRLVAALKDEADWFASGEDFNSRLRIRDGAIEVWEVREHVLNGFGETIVRTLPLLVLEATPVEALVNHLTNLHARLPDVHAPVALPDAVKVVQHASSHNGRTALRDEQHVAGLLAEVRSERERHPTVSPDREAAVCFKALAERTEQLGFPPERVLTFGSARGSNVLADVECLHVLGRPMAPPDELVFRAQVLHHDEPPARGQVELRPSAYGGQAYETDVVEFEDPRVSALLRATRDDEIVQMIHRARPFDVDPQTGMFGEQRRKVRLVLYTGHPVPGLRVDKLHITNQRTSLNEERGADAERRIEAASRALTEAGVPLTVTAVSNAARAHKKTVAKVLGTPVHTPLENLKEGMHRVPQSPPPDHEDAAPVGPRCRGGCGLAVPYDGFQCSGCAAEKAQTWARQLGIRTA